MASSAGRDHQVEAVAVAGAEERGRQRSHQRQRPSRMPFERYQPYQQQFGHQSQHRQQRALAPCITRTLTGSPTAGV